MTTPKREHTLSRNGFISVVKLSKERTINMFKIFCQITIVLFFVAFLMNSAYSQGDTGKVKVRTDTVKSQIQQKTTTTNTTNTTTNTYTTTETYDYTWVWVAGVVVVLLIVVLLFTMGGGGKSD